MKFDCLAGAAPATENETILLRQIGWMREMLARTVRAYGQEDKWLRGHLITLYQALSKRHPLLKRFYTVQAHTVIDVERREAWEVELAERIAEYLKFYAGPYSASELSHALEISERNIRKAIEGMVLDGHPIVCVQGGYKMAQTQSECLQYQRKLLGQAHAIMARAIAVGRIAYDFERGWK